MQSGKSDFNRGSRPRTSLPSSNTRPHPYNRSTSGSFNSEKNTNSTLPSGRWEHDKNDLFQPGSSVYNPVLGLTRDIIASPSLRPFGTATPLPHRPIAVPVGMTSIPDPPISKRTIVPVVETNSVVPKVDIFQRIGIKGSSSTSEFEKRRQIEAAKEEERRARMNREEEERRRRAFNAHHEKMNAKLRELAKIEERGFVVEVAGLVYGTSAEDVQTAFGQYGETTHCIIVNAETATEGDDLVARLVFERYTDADTAVTKLNGAIADGKTLRVRRGEKTVVPPVPSFVDQPQTTPVSIATPTYSISSAPRTMYADEVEIYDPRLQPAAPTSAYLESSYTDTDMDVEMDSTTASTPPIPTGPRNNSTSGKSGRGGRGGGRGGGLANGGQRLVEPISHAAATGGGSLLGRLNGNPSNNGGNSNGKNAGANSLLGRLK